MNASADPEEWTVAIGSTMPAWFYLAIERMNLIPLPVPTAWGADQDQWGQDGVIVTATGKRFGQGEVIRRADVVERSQRQHILDLMRRVVLGCDTLAVCD